MAKRLKFEEMPSWAQLAVRKAGSTGTLQMNCNSNSLMVQNGNATYNGRPVGRPGEDVTVGTDSAQDEIINFFRLPLWAWLPVLFANRYTSAQWSIFGHALTLSGSQAVYDGKQVRFF